MKDYILYFFGAVVLMGAVLFVLSVLAENVSDHEIITPEPGVKCVVVSRVFNTSVACWKSEAVG